MDGEIAEIKEVMGRHKELIYAVYGYYCGTGEAVETAMP